MKRLFAGTLAALMLMAAPATAGQGGQPGGGGKGHNAMKKAHHGKRLGGRLAEKAGWPGPRHVLAAARHLRLSRQQYAALQDICDTVQKRTRAMEAALADARADLRGALDSHRLTPGQLRHLVDRMHAIEADIQYLHLWAHTQTPRILSPRQIQAYHRLKAAHGGRAPGRGGRHGKGRHG